VWLVEREGQIARTRLALKLFHDEFADLAAIRKEAQLWIEAADHPNVLTIFEADIYDERFVLVSKYTPEGSLEDWIAAHGGKAPSVEAAVQLVIELLSGLEHLHGRGIVHRDVKPSNVLLSKGRPLIADFGLARIPGMDGSTCRIAGTPRYMAPEAFDGVRTPQTDLWAVGVILYRLLGGRFPFDAEDLSPLIRSIRNGSPDLWHLAESDRFRMVLERAFEKDCSRRYQSAAEMAAELMRPDGPSLLGIRPVRSSETQRSVAAQDGPGPGSIGLPALEIGCGPDRGKLYRLEKDRFLIGRAPDNDLCISMETVSRRHCQLVRDERGYSIVDLETRDGLYVNGVCVPRQIRVPLQNRDKIHIGDIILIYHSSVSTVDSDAAALERP
jgi:serine/threonine-protein kinase